VVSALIQGFNKKKFGEGNDLIPSANYVNLNYATCEDCGHPATNSRRMKNTKSGPEVAHAKDPLQMSGGEVLPGQKPPFFYQATCHDHWDLKGEEPLKYQFDRWLP
jgi:thymidine kinase